MWVKKCINVFEIWKLLLKQDTKQDTKQARVSLPPTSSHNPPIIKIPIHQPLSPNSPLHHCCTTHTITTNNPQIHHESPKKKATSPPNHCCTTYTSTSNPQKPTNPPPPQLSLNPQTHREPSTTTTTKTTTKKTSNPTSKPNDFTVNHWSRHSCP